MPRLLCLALGTLLAVVVPSVALAATTIEYHAVVRDTFGRSAAPSGVGVVAGFGSVTEVFEFTGATPTGDSACPIETTGFTTLTFLDGSTLTTFDTQLLCFPGGSTSAPGSQVSYGNPTKWVGTWEVVDGTGMFDGATGSGTLRIGEHGDVLIVYYDGLLTLP